MIDIHCHILPGMDDGAHNLDISIEMCRIAGYDGIKTIIATPHYFPEQKETKNADMVLKQVKVLNRELKLKNIDVMVLSGMEVFICDEIIGLLDSKEILTLNNSRYLLIELPLFSIPLCTQELFYKLMIKGIVPVIAHPERNSCIINNPGIVLEYVHRGVLIQIDTGSLKGEFGQKVKKTAKTLLKNKSVHFMATDAHNANTRTPQISETFKYVKHLNKELAESIFLTNPFFLINNQAIPSDNNSIDM